MPRLLTLRLCLGAACLFSLLSAPAASAAGAYTRVLHAYETRGQLPACLFSSQELDSALKGIDTYGAQYFQDFGTAIQGALSARASGACLKGGAGVRSRTGAAAASAQSLPGLIAPGDGGLPAPLLILGVLCAALALAGLCAGALWFLGIVPPGADWCRHLCAETGERARGTWLELGDWLRSGSA